MDLYEKALRHIDEEAVRPGYMVLGGGGITDLMIVPGLMNLDFADVTAWRALGTVHGFWRWQTTEVARQAGKLLKRRANAGPVPRNTTVKKST